MLDRLLGANPPALVCVDPRRTEVARHATVHLAVWPGTNVAPVNGLAQQLFEHGWVDEDYIAAPTVGLVQLEATVADYPAKRVSEICGVASRDVEAAAELFGTCERPLSTVLHQQRSHPVERRSLVAASTAG